MRTTQDRKGAVKGTTKAAGIGLSAQSRPSQPRSSQPRPSQPRPSGNRPRRNLEPARGIRQRSVNDRLPRQYDARPPHRPHRSGRRSGGCLSSIAALIIMLAIVFVVVFQDDIKEKLFSDDTVTTIDTEVEYSFKNATLLNDHYEKHGIEMGYNSAASYLEAANAVVNNPKSLHKIEAEDGDDVYYLESTNEFVVVSKEGFIRTYFYPEDGIDYYNRQ